MELEEDVSLETDESDELNQAESNGDAVDEDEMEGEEQPFDITLAASHAYMGSALSSVSGRVVLEAGWVGRVPALAHHGCVFPGETLPMLLADERDAAIIQDALNKDKLFGLLCPDETGQKVSGYGVMCEVFEVATGERAAAAAGGLSAAVSFKARAVHRFRMKDMPKGPLPIALLTRLRYIEVVVLPEQPPAAPLRHARLACLDARRPHRAAPASPAHQHVERVIKRADAALTPWPVFVFEMFDYPRMRTTIREYFQGLGLDRLMPEDAVSLSFWVASNLTLSPRDRLALFVLDSALLRLHAECRLIARRSVVCCGACGARLARREHAVGMSSEGAHGNYTNPGGHVHDVLTVSAARNLALSGAPERHYSWFPGYAWTIALCACCSAHVGWRFDALRRNLRPQQFYGLCRNHVRPRSLSPSPPPPPGPPAPAAGPAGGPRRVMQL